MPAKKQRAGAVDQTAGARTPRINKPRTNERLRHNLQAIVYDTHDPIATDYRNKAVETYEAASRALTVATKTQHAADEARIRAHKLDLEARAAATTLKRKEGEAQDAYQTLLGWTRRSDGDVVQNEQILN